MIELDSFRELVDSSADQISSIKGNLLKLYDYFGLPSSSVLSLHAINDVLSENIRSSFVTHLIQIRHHCRCLRRQLIFEHALLGQPLDPYIDIINLIHDATADLPKNQGPADNWGSAVNAAYDYLRISPGLYKMEERPRLYNREFAVGWAAKRLQERGFNISIKNDQFILEGDSEKRIIARLEELIMALGGINVAANIFRDISSLYNPQQERYNLVRQVTQSGDNISPRVPCGYLLLLAVKHPFMQLEFFHQEENWQELLSLSRDYAAILNVQPYDGLEPMFLNHTTLILFLQKLALYDTLFTIPQIRPLDAVKITQGILSWLDWDKEYDKTWKLNEALKVGEEVLKLGRQYRGPTCITARKLMPLCASVRPGRIFDILEKLFSHPSPGANQHYTLPTNISGISSPDFSFHPLLSDGQGSQWLLDASVCAPAVMESLLSRLRKEDKDIDGKLGVPIEQFLRAEFKAHRLTVKSGKYRVLDKEGECDLIVETSDSILFFEVKKKALTRKARAGSDVDILMDLSSSLIAAQLEAGKHEISIRKIGYLDLVNADGQTERIGLEGRNIERIAVTLLDFGSFQDRMLLQQFLLISLNARYATTDISKQDKFFDLDTKILELRRQVGELSVLDKGPTRNPFFHCWFLSVPQVLILLDSVRSNDDLKNALWETRHVYTGTLDFYFEHAQAKQRNLQNNGSRKQ